MKNMSQNEMVLQHLQRFGSITPKDALENYGIMRLGARIYNLRSKGHNIIRENEHSVNRFGRAVVYARYWLKA